MDRREAEELVKQEGFRIKELIEEDGETFFFSCFNEENDDYDTVVCVENGAVLIAPT